jgi:hypothetical protein
MFNLSFYFGLEKQVTKGSLDLISSSLHFGSVLGMIQDLDVIFLCNFEPIIVDARVVLIRNI